ncbi:MAG: TIGR04211 family SH3 domain-containing protein [Methylococcaceae bacterium]
MKIIPYLFFILALTFGSAQAKTVYTDEPSLLLKNEENIEGKVLKVLLPGTPLTVIKENSKTGFIHVRVDKDTQGYIQARHTKKTPPDTETANKNMASLQAENTSIKAELAALKDSMTPGSSLEQSLASEHDQLSKELNELKKTAAGSAQLKNERDELQERVVNVERELQQYKLENQALKDTADQDWFLYGGLLALAGVILGFILPKLGWRRKSSWDSF